MWILIVRFTASPHNIGPPGKVKHISLGQPSEAAAVVLGYAGARSADLAARPAHDTLGEVAMARRTTTGEGGRAAVSDDGVVGRDARATNDYDWLPRSASAWW